MASLINNPYLADYKATLQSDDDDYPDFYSRPYTQDRHRLVRLYSFAIPDDGAVAVIKAHAPQGVVEMGAGTGYWAYVLTQGNIRVVAYDHEPGALNHYVGTKQWAPVRLGYTTAVRKHPEMALMLCWPPHRSKMASTCLGHYAGDTVIYIGEDDGGCTGDEAFFRRLNAEWERVTTYSIPQWPGLHDELTIWRRK